MIENDATRLWNAVLAHRERLLRIARARTASAQDAEDCVQEAMLRCIEFDNLDESRLGPFLTTVTVRLCADRYRESANDERLRRRLGFREREAPGHEDEICDRGEAAWLAREFAGLTPRQQEIVRARSAGLSCAEVASRLQVSYVAVESSLARVRSRFRDTLAKSMGGLSPLALRWTTVCAEVATAAAVVVSGGIAAAPLPGPSSVARSPVARGPVGAERVPDTDSTVTEDAVAYVPPSPTASYRGGGRTPAGLPGVAKKPTEPIVEATYVDVAPDERHGEYSTSERVMHCVQYGIKTKPIQCRYPDEKETR